MTPRAMHNKYFAFVAIAAIALVALTAMMVIQAGRNGEAGLSSPSGSFSVQGWVSYVVRDASGNITATGAEHNTINSDPALDKIWADVINSGTNTYKRVGVLSVAVGTDNPSDGVTNTSVLTMTTNGVTSNNVDGTATAGSAGSGTGTVAATFTGQGSGGTITQIVLHNESGTLATTGITDAKILAYQDVPDVTLAAGDTVTYTWTITFS